MKARHEFREEAERLWDVEFKWPFINGKLDELPEGDEEWISAKTKELYYSHLRVEFFKSAMQGILSNDVSKADIFVAEESMILAEKMITELKKELK